MRSGSLSKIDTQAAVLAEVILVLCTWLLRLVLHDWFPGLDTCSKAMGVTGID